ncbi:Very-long-chain aldehyde decarbonylase GL1-9 [Asimina triloba]
MFAKHFRFVGEIGVKPYSCAYSLSGFVYFGEMVFWEGYLSDESMGTYAPIVLYWVYAGFYQLLPPLDRFRLHTRKEEEQKNLVPMPSVIKGVLLQQLVQATVAQMLFSSVASFRIEGKMRSKQLN